MSQALRFNDDKIQLSRIREFGSAIRKVVSVMQQGAIKYEDGNWLLGGKPDKEYLDSLDRHVQLFTEGEIYDKDSGNHHMAHAAWNCLALLRLNADDLPEIDPEFDQEAFIARWSSTEAPAPVYRPMTKEEYLALDVGDTIFVHVDAETEDHGEDIVQRIDHADPQLRVRAAQAGWAYQEDLQVIDG